MDIDPVCTDIDLTAAKAWRGRDQCGVPLREPIYDVVIDRCCYITNEPVEDQMASFDPSERQEAEDAMRLSLQRLDALGCWHESALVSHALELFRTRETLTRVEGESTISSPATRPSLSSRTA